MTLPSLKPSLPVPPLTRMKSIAPLPVKFDGPVETGLKTGRRFSVGHDHRTEHDTDIRLFDPVTKSIDDDGGSRGRDDQERKKDENNQSLHGNLKRCLC